METYSGLLLFILFVFGILQIILFFKLWGMTNNIKEMAKDLFEIKKITASDSSEATRKTLVKKEMYNALNSRGQSMYARSDEQLALKIESAVNSQKELLNNVIKNHDCQNCYSIDEFKNDLFELLKNKD